MKLFVRNIPYKFTEQDLQRIFETVGTVVQINIIKDKFTQRSRGFGFVEMETEEEGQQAIEKITGYEVEGLSLTVEKAQEKREQKGGGNFRPRREFRENRESRGGPRQDRQGWGSRKGGGGHSERY